MTDWWQGFAAGYGVAALFFVVAEGAEILWLVKHRRARESGEDEGHNWLGSRLGALKSRDFKRVNDPRNRK